MHTWVDVFGLDCGRVAKARARQRKMLKNNEGYNISPLSWDNFSTIGRSGTFITDRFGALTKYFKKIGNGGQRIINKNKASHIEKDLGLDPGSLKDGFKIRKITNIRDMSPRSPLEGNNLFQGPGKHLPGGAPEMVINSISTVDNANVTTMLTVLVK